MDEIGPELEAILTGFDFERWRRASNDYFDRTPQPNNLFNILATSWMTERVLPVLQPDLFRQTVKLVEDWESAHPGDRRHKGSPYYWLGMAYTLLGDLDQGFVYMHLALEEDRRTAGVRVPLMPAFAFVSLDAQTDQQAFKQAVDAFAAFIEDRMQAYRTTSGGALDLPAMRTKVIAVESRWDAMFHLVYATARIRRLDRMGPAVTATPFGRNLLAQAIGDLCVVADEWLQQGWPGDGEFYQHMLRYLVSRGVTDAQQVHDAVNVAVRADWAATFIALLDHSPIAGSPRTLSRVESDLAVTRLMRNSAAHAVTANGVLATRLADIERRVYASIFAIVEDIS